MKSFRPELILFAVCSLLIGSVSMTAPNRSALAAVPVDNLSAATNRELARARNATAKYHNVAQAIADGYVNEGYVPGEGFEYVNEDLIDCTFDVEQPEALLYIPSGNGLRLVGVEYIVPTVCTATGPEGFAGDADVWEENAEGLPIWALRAWLWLPNPDGMFAGTNPRVP